MLVVLLLFTSTFATEVAQSLGKASVRQRRESVYDLIVLGLFWGFIFLLLTMLFGAPAHIAMASLPTLIPRIVLEILLAYIAAQAVIRTDRTTLGFLRLLVLPLLLVVDIALGYHLSLVQMIGIALMFSALILVFRHNPEGRRGAWLAALNAIVSVGTISLYKYDITHYNSVAGEQSLVIGIVLTFFTILSFRHHGRPPFRLLFRPVGGTQSLANGIAVAIESYALGLAPASVVIALKRSLSLVWTIVFGRAYFHEHSLGRKASSGLLMVTSIFLIAAPQLLHIW